MMWSELFILIKLKKNYFNLDKIKEILRDKHIFNYFIKLDKEECKIKPKALSITKQVIQN